MYVDDTTIYFNLEDFDPYHLKRDINNELEKNTLWLKMNKLYLNVQKNKIQSKKAKQHMKTNHRI